MAVPTPPTQLLTARRLLACLGVVLLLLVPTGAYVLNEGLFDAIGPEEELILEPYDGPNGGYATIDSNAELRINITDDGVNPDAVTDIDRIFTITNTGNTSKQVWFTHTNEHAITFYAESTGQLIGERHNVTLEPQERLVVGMRVDTRDPTISAEETLVTTLLIHTRTLDPDTTPALAAPAELEFDDVTVGTQTTRTILIENTGNRTLSVQSLSITGGDADAFTLADDAAPTTLAPGDAMTVDVTAHPATPGAKQATLTVGTNTSATVTTALSVTGVERRLGLVAGATVDFGPVTPTETRTRTVTVRNDGQAPVTLTGVAVGNDPAGAFAVTGSVLPVTLAPGETTAVEMAFTPPAVGTTTATLTATTAGTPSPEPVAVGTLHGTGAAAQLTVTPSPIAFGDVGTNRTANRTMELTNTGTLPLWIENMSVTGTDADQFAVHTDVIPTTLQPGDTVPVRLSFTPTRAANLSATLRVTSNDSETLTRSVPVQGTGVGAEIGVDEDELDFGNVSVGTTKSLNITVRNLEGSPTDLTVRRARLVGRDADAFSITGGAPPRTLAPGETSELEITYAPETVGIKTAQLQIFSDASNEPQINVWLSNTGWRILVREIPRGERGVDADDEPTQLDTATISDGATNVEMDVNGITESMDVSVNVSMPQTRARGAAMDEVQFTATEPGDFDMNFIHHTGPPTTDATTYSAPEGRTTVQYVRLWESQSSESFANPVLQFRVRKASLPAGAGPESVAFRRYEDGTWTAYEPTLLRESGSHYVFRVALPGLSEFAITAPATEGGADEPGTPSPPPADDGDGGVPRDDQPGSGRQDGDETDGPTVEHDGTSITFPDDADQQTLESRVSVETLSVPSPGAGRTGPRARIQSEIGVGEGDTETFRDPDSGTSFRVSRTPQTAARIEAKGADAMTLVGTELPLTASHSLFTSKESIDDNWRMIHRVEITVPPEYENRSAVVRMRIPRERFGTTAPANATIGRQHGGWQLLDTTVVEATDDVVVLEAVTPGFSTFAVFADNQVRYEWTVETYDERFTDSRIAPRFEQTGLYTVSLTVTDAFGLTDSSEYRILANDQPTVRIHVDGVVAANETVVLTAAVNDAIGNVTVHWTLPDGTTVTGRQVEYSVAPGEQPIRVVAEDEFGARGTAERTLDGTARPALEVPLPAWAPQGWWLTLALAGLMCLVPLIVVLRGHWLPVAHPPLVDVFGKPVVDSTGQRVMIPRLRIVDRGHDMAQLAVTVFDYHGNQVAHKSGGVVDGRTYDEREVWVAVAPDQLLRGESYVVEVYVTDEAGNRTVRARAVDTDPFVYPRLRVAEDPTDDPKRP